MCIIHFEYRVFQRKQSFKQNRNPNQTAYDNQKENLTLCEFIYLTEFNCKITNFYMFPKLH